MKSRRFALALGLLIGLPTALAAQTTNTENFRELAEKIVVESKVFPLMRDTPEGSASPEPTVSLLATSDGTVAKARLGYLLKSYVGLDVTFAGPVGSGSAQLFTHKGVSTGASVEGALRLVLHRSQHSVPANLRRLESLNNLGNLPEVASLINTDKPFEFDQLVERAAGAAARIDQQGGASLAPRVVSGESVAELFRPVTPGGAAPVSDDAFAHAFRLMANDLEAWQVDNAVVLSLSGGRSRPSFTVVDGAQFKTVEKPAKSAEISLGYISSARKDKLAKGFYAGFTFGTGTSYSATPRNTCLPVGESGASQCRNAVLAEPPESSFETYRGEVRYFFSDLKFAIGLRPGYDRKAAENEKWWIEAPFMFLQNSKDLQSALSDDKAGLTGGVTLGFKDTPNGASFYALFSVGSLFRLPGLP